MFDKNYKDAMDSIAPKTETKEKILEKIELKEAAQLHKNPAVAWRVAFACVACVAVVLGAIFMPRTKDKNPTAPAQNQSITQPQTTVLTVSKSYDEVYKIFENKKIIEKWRGAFGFYVTDDAEIMIDEFSGGLALPGSATNVNGGSDTNTKNEFTNTTEQVQGVSEADIVKTDGKNIYYLSRDYGDQKINIFSADKENSKLLAQIELGNIDSNTTEMFLKEDRLIVLQVSYNTGMHAKDNSGYAYNPTVSILIYDISNPANPKAVATVCQQGSYTSARMIDDKIYLISNCAVNLDGIDKDDPATYVPTTTVNGTATPVPAEKIYCYDEALLDYPQYAVIGSYNYLDGKMYDSASVLGGTGQIYCSQNNIILTKSVYCGIEDAKDGIIGTTTVSRLQIDDGKIEYKASGSIDGTLKNQFFIDEYNGCFRFVTTVTTARQETVKFDNSSQSVISYETENSAKLTILDGELKLMGQLKDLAPDESVYSVRFMGDTAYFVTFRQVDPLFSADLSDPKNPKILGELKIPGFSDYLYPYGNGLLLGFGQDADETTGRVGELKLSMFNITDPSNVTEDDVTIIDDHSYSPALNNHKDMLVSTDKNLIGFAAHASSGRLNYLIYKYTEDGFVNLATIELSENWKYFSARGIFINDEFYVINETLLNAYDLESFTLIKSVEF